MLDDLKTLKVSRGAEVAYRLWRPNKHRRLLVLIHGMASNMTRWSEFYEHTSLVDSWDILRVDLRGHGHSLYRGKLSWRIWSLDLCDIMDKERYQDAVFVGHSLGAQLAIYFANHYPSRVSGLVLIDPILHAALNKKQKRMRLMGPLLSLTAFVTRLLNKIGIHRQSIPLRDLRVLDEATRMNLLNKGKQEEMIGLYSSPWPDIKHFPLGNYLQESMMSLAPIKGPLSLNVPVLSILASAPTFTDLKRTEELLSRIPDITISHVPAFHWPLTEKPVETREAIEKWCQHKFGAS